MSLEALEHRVHRDLAMTAHPRMDWMPVRTRNGAPVLDVLIVGAGQSGLATAFALIRDRVTNILVIDRAPQGREGPWTTYARMPTLRSPKDFTGPDLGQPALTFQAWFEAQHGPDAWTALHLISRQDWQAYLDWFRRVLDLPVRNGTRLTAITPTRLDDGLLGLEATLDTGETLVARKIVLATGQDGTGTWWMPDFIEALPPDRRAHAADPIDFTSLRGRHVAVLGAGASAMDNAATALEHGATVDLFCRRAEPTVVQRYRWLTFTGFLRHIGDMPDEWRWRMMGHIIQAREGFPADTWRRVTAHPNFTMHIARPWTDARIDAHQVRIETPRGPVHADFVICGTGIRHDPAQRPELAAFAHHIATWQDRYTPPPGEESDMLAAFPYLGPDFAFQEKRPGAAPFLQDIHLFAIGATLSQGPSGSSINAMTNAVPKLVAGLTRGLFAADLPHHWQSLLAYDTPQVELDWSRIAAE